MQLFEKYGSTSKGVVFKRGMENMLGKFGYPNGRWITEKKETPPSPKVNKQNHLFFF